MRVVRTISELKSILKKKRDNAIGFVPTMGAFHEGHLSLMEQSIIENAITVVSLFVNPLQFGPSEDFDTYPRTENKDIERLEKIKVDYLFVPSVEEMYPTEPSIDISLHERTDKLCGQSRPNHFDGVATVLLKLFNIVQPNRVYMGLKDAQQFSVVDLLVRDLNIPIELVGLPTIREENGLAKSSRNEYLTNQEKQDAAVIHRSLLKAQKLLINQGIKEPKQIEQIVKSELENVKNSTIDYIDVLSYPSLKQINNLEDTFIIAVAINFKNARLIDNLILSAEGKTIDLLRRNSDATNDDAR